MTDQTRAEKSPRRGAPMTWRMIADELAERLMFASEPCTAHKTPAPDECPFCKDGEALRLYRERGGDVVMPTMDGPTVSIEELSRRGR